MVLIRSLLISSLILSTSKSEREFSSTTMKREVNFCSDLLSDLIFSKGLVQNQITYGFRTVPNWNVFAIPLKKSTQNRHKLVEQRTQQ